MNDVSNDINAANGEYKASMRKFGRQRVKALARDVVAQTEAATREKNADEAQRARRVLLGERRHREHRACLRRIV